MPPPADKPKVQSTPQNRGTASDAEYHMIPGSFQNIRNVEADLKGTQPTDFEMILKAFLMRDLLGPIQDPIKPEVLEVLKQRKDAKNENVETKFNKLLEDAVVFSNHVQEIFKQAPRHGTSPKDLCAEVKYYLGLYCNETAETKRYDHLVDALNTILLWQCDTDPEFVFVKNDPVIIKSPLLDNTAKRKPDIILVPIVAYKQWLGDDCQEYTFEDCRTAIAKGKGRSLKSRPSWLDVNQFWELKKDTPTISSAPLAAPFKSSQATGPETSNTNQSATGSSTSTRATPAAQNTPSESASKPSRKRKGEETSSNKPKRSRSDNQTSAGVSAPERDGLVRITHRVQCAYYAIERFRSSWDVTHATGVYLSGSSLCLLWYDSQGCIESSSIDIIQQLPLFVVLVKVLQGFAYLSGIRATKSALPGYVHKDDAVGPNYQLSGRRTYSASFTPSTPASSTRSPSTPATFTATSSTSATSSTPVTGSSAPDNTQASRRSERLKTSKSSASTDATPPGAKDATHFFKVAWPEDCRTKEHLIIKEAIRRVELLPPEHQDAVKDHLPDVFAADEIADTSTAIIRVLLGLSTEGSRSQVWMVSKKLQSFRTIASTPAVFRCAYLEIVRCHFLLWVIGIAHGDVSFSNCMFDPAKGKGILNDFDLASIMNPGDSSPLPSGHERTGTKPFMALDLLTEEGFNGSIPRRYRHELEAFTWLLLWACVCTFEEGKENMDVEPIKRWVGVDHRTVRERKTTFLFDLHNFKPSVVTPLYGQFEQELRRSLEVWDEMFYAQKHAQKEHRKWDEPPGVQFLGKIMDIWRKTDRSWLEEKPI